MSRPGPGCCGDGLVVEGDGAAGGDGIGGGDGTVGEVPPGAGDDGDGDGDDGVPLPPIPVPACAQAAPTAVATSAPLIASERTNRTIGRSS